MPTTAYNVYLRGKLLDTVFQSGQSTAAEVRRSLINHDGYDDAIKVTKARGSSPAQRLAKQTRRNSGLKRFAAGAPVRFFDGSGKLRSGTFVGYRAEDGYGIIQDRDSQ